MPVPSRLKQLKLEQDSARLRAEREGLAAANAPGRISSATEALRQAQIADAIDSTPATKKAAAAAAKELEEIIDAESAAIERARILDDAIASLDAQLPALARVAEEEEKEAVKKALCERAEVALAAVRAALPVLWMSARVGGPGVVSLKDLGAALNISEGAVANQAAALRAEILASL